MNSLIQKTETKAEVGGQERQKIALVANRKIREMLHPCNTAPNSGPPDLRIYALSPYRLQ
jgi:hypothetical protein